MVADNDPDALELAVTDLRLEGHDVVAACHDGTGALEACRALQPDVVVVDHRMPPGPYGAEVAERLAATVPQVRVIVFTNHQDPVLARRVRSCGATYLPKGDLRRLRRVVRGTSA